MTTFSASVNGPFLRRMWSGIRSCDVVDGAGEGDRLHISRGTAHRRGEIWAKRATRATWSPVLSSRTRRIWPAGRSARCSSSESSRGRRPARRSGPGPILQAVSHRILELQKTVILALIPRREKRPNTPQRRLPRSDRPTRRTERTGPRLAVELPGCGIKLHQVGRPEIDMRTSEKKSPTEPGVEPDEQDVGTGRDRQQARRHRFRRPSFAGSDENSDAQDGQNEIQQPGDRPRDVPDARPVMRLFRALAWISTPGISCGPC